MAGRLRVGSHGRLRGPASITYNNPWPCPNGQWGMSVPQGVLGVVMHTMVGNLPGTIKVFNTPSYQASAHFGIDQNGHIHQFGPVNGWIAWAQVAGNPNWYSIEHADNGNPDNPLTDAQLTASAQVVEALATYGVFPLRVSNSPSQEGYGVHYMGGSSWGGHTCPDSPPGHVRSHQRGEILRRARLIRQGAYPPPPPPPPPGQPATVVTDGTLGLMALAARYETDPATVLSATAEASASGDYDSALATYVNTVFATDSTVMPDGMVLNYQEEDGTGGTWETGRANHPEDPQPLHALAELLGTDCESIIRLTAGSNPGKLFTGVESGYINGVFSRSQALLPPGLTLHLKQA